MDEEKPSDMVRTELVYVTFPYPYSLRAPNVLDERAVMARRWCAEMSRLSFITINPHLYHWLITGASSESMSWEKQKQFILPLIANCSSVQILMFKGWEESANVREEIEFAKANKITIHYVNTKALEDWYHLRNLAYSNDDGSWGPNLGGSSLPVPVMASCRRVGDSSGELRDAESVDGGPHEGRPNSS